MNLSSVKKSIISVLTIICTVAPWVVQAVGVISPPTAGVISAVVFIIGSVIHYQAPNTTTDPAIAANQSVKLVAPRTAA